VFEGLWLFEAGAVEAVSEIPVLAPIDFVLQDALEGIEGAETRLVRLPSIERLEALAGQLYPRHVIVVCPPHC
jgi:hypothetical protein